MHSDPKRRRFPFFSHTIAAGFLLFAGFIGLAQTAHATDTPVNARGEWIEDFERFDTLETPTSSHYVLSVSGTGQGAYVVSDSLAVHGKVLANSRNAVFATSPLGYSDFYFRGPIGTSVSVQSYLPGSTPLAGLDASISFTVASSSSVGAAYNLWNGAGFTVYSLTFGTTINPITNWVHVGYRSPDYTGAWTALNIDDAAVYQKAITNPPPVQFKWVAFSGTATSTLSYLDSLNLGQQFNTGGAFQKVASIAVHQLNGFDVDQAGQTIIIREVAQNTPPATQCAVVGNGENSQVVSIGAAGDLNTGAMSRGQCVPSHCGTTDGVAAVWTPEGGVFLTYVDCTHTSSSETTEFRIRNANLGTPTFNVHCGNGCDDNPTSSVNIAIPDKIKQVGRIEAAAWDMSNSKNCDPGGPSPGGADGSTCNFPAESSHNIVSWSYTTTDGYIGLFSVIDNGGVLPDREGDARVAVNSIGGPVQDFCSWRVHNNNAANVGGRAAWGPGFDLIGVASAQAPTTVFLADSGADSATVTTGILPHLTTKFSQSGDYGNADSIGCGQDHILIGKTAGGVGTVASFRNILTNGGVQTRQWAKTTGIIPNRGVTVSGDGYIGAYLTSTQGNSLASSTATITIVNMTTGNVIATVPDANLPSTGNYYGMKMDYTAQNLWFATDSEIDRFLIQNATTGEPISPTQPPPGCQIDCTVGGNGNNGNNGSGIFGNPGVYDLSGGGDSVKGGLTLMVLFVLAMAAAGAGIPTGKNRVWGAGLGAVLGFALIVYYGAVPGTIVFLVSALAVVIIMFRAKGSSAAGD